ncbi:RecE family exodeoxyribonuclease [Kluyvera ascorbata]|uniref:RecE family exodeoxyribonuclease n=1 Tax=Kluyvera ascorbata TaxID=51288 RepID=UPI0035101CBF
MEFFHVVKATQKSGKKDAVIWFSAKSEARANLQLDVELEDAGIETGRGKDYMKPIRTDFPVFNDLPEESTVDLTWCERYKLADDQRTWQLKDGAAPQDAFHQEDAEQDEDVGHESKIVNVEYNLAPMGFRVQLLAQFIADDLHVYCINKETQARIASLEMDTDNTYVQNLLLAAENAPEVKTFDMPTLWKLTTAVKTAFPQDKRCELNQVIQFVKAWATTEHIDRGLLVKEWQKGNRVAQIQRTDVKTNAGGGNKTDRNPDLVHTLDTLDIDIALATLPRDFNIYDIPGGVFRRAKEIVSNKESPFKEWSEALRKTAGILDYSRAAIFATIRSAHPNIHHFPGRLTGYINANLTETDHEHPTEETLAASGHVPEKSWENEINEKVAAEQKAADEQPKIGNVGGGIFSVEGLTGNQPAPALSVVDQVRQRAVEEKLHQANTEETTSDEPMEETECAEGKVNDAVSAGESAVEDDPQADTVTGTVCTGCGAVGGAVGGGHCPECGAVMGDSTYAAMAADLKEEVDTLEIESCNAEILATAAPSLAADVQSMPEVDAEPEVTAEEPEDTASVQEELQAEYPAFFEPGRYEGLPNEVYHAANGISSTQVKDARVSLMYFNARHVEKTITKERSPVLDMGNLVHVLALQPELLDAEFSVEPVIPEGAFTTTATIRAFIDEHNANLPALLSADDIKVLLEQHNATLPAPLSADDIKVLLEQYNATLPAQVQLGTAIDETAQSYMALPPEYQRIGTDQKQTATAMKACIKEYNSTLPALLKTSGSRDALLEQLAVINADLVEQEANKPAPVKTSGSRDALLEQLAIINSDLVAQEAQKPQPLKVSGTKADLIQAVKSVNPGAVFADELLDAWRDNPEGKVLVTRQQLRTALNIQKALLQHPTAGKLLTHPSRAVEVSYFGFDDETGLEVRVRPDLEIDLDGVRIGADLKTISMWNIKQEGLRAKLHREIIDRDYHLSAAMYCETAALDQFFWIFVNKDENYHWIAIIEASAELLELGMLEYRKAMRAIATGFDTGEWPAPITADYTDELNDFDQRRLEALRLA